MQEVTLVEVAGEPEAAMIVARLDAEGISACLEGQLTSAFRAEAPGRVSVLVRREDLDRARDVLRRCGRG